MHDNLLRGIVDMSKILLISLAISVAEATKARVAVDPATRGPTIGDVIPGLNVEPGSYLMPLWGVFLLILAPATIGLSWSIFEVIRLHKLPIDGTGVARFPDSGESTNGDSPLLSESTAVEKSLKMMRQVSAHIAEGATAFLVEEYKYLLVYIIIFGIVIGVVTSWFAALSFLVGAITSCLSGFIGMRTAVFCNVRTAHECWKELRLGYDVAIRGGSVMGFSLVSLGVFTLFGLVSLLNAVMKLENSAKSYDGPSILFEALAGYGLGASSIALFARVGGGIYTKAADVGADLSGKNEYGMDEDDPRNPACIADNVGDNVGDVAGMGADLFGSFAEATCAAFVLIGNSTLSHLNIYEAPIMYPLLISSSGIFVSWFTVLFLRLAMPVKDIPCIEKSLKYLLFVSTLLMTPVIIGLSYVCLPPEFMVGIRSPLLPQSLKEEDAGKMVEWYACMASVLMGLWSGLLVGIVTEYFTSHSYRPVRDIAESQRTSAATGIIYGLALGYLSTIVPVLALSVTILVSHEFCGMYGIALAALGMLSTLCVGLAIDAYGPIADNAGGIAEMSHLGAPIRRRTDALDAAGNTTAAVGKGFAIGSAALVALALFGAFCTRANIDKVNVLNAWTFAGVLYGAMMPYAFSALTMKSVGKAATDMVAECMRQFPKIINEGAPPDYTRCISISTSASLREMILPGALVILSPLVFGILCGKNATAGLLVGSLSSGVQMAISMSNTGGAWDNAKKYIEAGGLGPEHGKGSATHKHAVTGDTVGDPLKDTSGPSLNILIKLSAIISLVFGSLIDIRFSNASGGPIWLKASTVPKMPSAPPSQPSHPTGPTTWKGRGGNAVPVAAKSPAPTPSMNGFGGKGFGKGKGGGWSDGVGKGGGGYDGGKGKGGYQEDIDDRPDERTGGNATEITSLLPMFRDDYSPSNGKGSGGQTSSGQSPQQGGSWVGGGGPSGGDTSEEGGDSKAQEERRAGLEQEKRKLQNILERQRHEGQMQIEGRAVVGGLGLQAEAAAASSPPQQSPTRYDDSYQERRLDNRNGEQQLDQPEGYEDTYRDEYPSGGQDTAGRDGDDDRAMPSPPTGPVGYTPPPAVNNERAQQDTRRVIRYENMVGEEDTRQQVNGIAGSERYNGGQREMERGRRPAAAPAGEYDNRSGPEYGRTDAFRPGGRYVSEEPVHDRRMEQQRAEPPRREDFAPDPRQPLSHLHTMEPVRQQQPQQSQQQQHRYYPDDYIDPYESRRTVPARGEYYRSSERYVREEPPLYSGEDPLCPDSIRRGEYGREYRRAPPPEPRYDPRESERYSWSSPADSRPSYRDEIREMRDARTRFTRSRPEPCYSVPAVGYRRIPKLRFENSERRELDQLGCSGNSSNAHHRVIQETDCTCSGELLHAFDFTSSLSYIKLQCTTGLGILSIALMMFVDDANQLVSVPFNLSVDDRLRRIRKDDIKEMTKEELRALRARLQQDRARLDERIEQCHSEYADIVTRVFHLDYSPAVEPHPRILFGLQGFDAPSTTRLPDDRGDLISFDRKSVTSSSGGRRYDEAAAPCASTVVCNMRLRYSILANFDLRFCASFLIRTPDREPLLPGPPSPPPRAYGPPSSMDSVPRRSPPVEPVMPRNNLRDWEGSQGEASRDSLRVDSVPDGCCPMCHAKFPDEDSLQQHAENCNDQCPERTERPSGPGIGCPVYVKSSYTPDEGDDNQVELNVGDEVLLSELDDGMGWTMVNKDGMLGWVPTAALDLEQRMR
ncbi:hypothetical protein FOL47_006305 [Perkinsus chesapeaki]|uniref:H(+)-exporting diphosphatase n=1 Tax=Perkinsus chesapeaki TaxID=330153 RepID=A0A7J6MZW3_PERCH|nr:hypothetical protein FOL47_006305 [Perkinsus chesapeaki]